MLSFSGGPLSLSSSSLLSLSFPSLPFPSQSTRIHFTSSPPATRSSVVLSLTSSFHYSKRGERASGSEVQRQDRRRAATAWKGLDTGPKSCRTMLGGARCLQILLILLAMCLSYGKATATLLAGAAVPLRRPLDCPQEAPASSHWAYAKASSTG
eukprot:scaffold436_cov267-Pinguiococcus_pyrenoidosus.AAC.15